MTKAAPMPPCPDNITWLSPPEPLGRPPSLQPYQNSPSSCRWVSCSLTSGSTVFQLGQLENHGTGRALEASAIEDLSPGPQSAGLGTRSGTSEGPDHPRLGKACSLGQGGEGRRNMTHWREKGRVRAAHKWQLS